MSIDLDFGVQINSIEQSINSNSLTSETYLITGLLSLMVILITASLSSITYNKVFSREDLTFEKTE